MTTIALWPAAAAQAVLVFYGRNGNKYFPRMLIDIAFEKVLLLKLVYFRGIF